MGLRELDRFSETSLERWNAVSRDLDELHDSLYFGLEPERRRYRPDLIAALNSVGSVDLCMEGWCRAVTYRYSLAPLSCAGSLQYIGGRFNAGTELDPQTLAAWPALYLAADFETAFREKFQLPSDSLLQGLTPADMALSEGASLAAVRVNGQLVRAFDMTHATSLNAVSRVFRRIAMPTRAAKLRKKLGISDAGMVRTAQHAYDAVLKHNWRIGPIQFGLPSPSQILAELIRAAGFEAILYQSTKGPGRCVAVFPDRLQDPSFVELADAAPPEVSHRRLDADSANDLAGWDTVASQFKAR